MPVAAPAVHVERITVRHIGRRAPALRDFSLEWAPGERLLLLGPSGAGKSTLALCLNGLIPHSVEAHWEAGRILVDGQDTRQASLGRLTRQVGLLFQDPEAQLALLEVDDEVAFGLENLGTPRPAKCCGASRRRAPCSAWTRPAHRPRLDQLSGGTKQRVTLAAILAMGPGALVLDEPTANLDPQGTTELFDTLADLCRDSNRSLLLVEHRLDDILALIDRVVVLDERGTGRPDRSSPRDIRADTPTRSTAWACGCRRSRGSAPSSPAPRRRSPSRKQPISSSRPGRTHQSRQPPALPASLHSSRKRGDPPRGPSAAILAAEQGKLPLHTGRPPGVGSG